MRIVQIGHRVLVHSCVETWSTLKLTHSKCLSVDCHKIDPRRSSAEGSPSPFSSRMNDMMQRGAQQPSSSDRNFRRASMDDLVLRQQRLLRQDNQYQGQENSNSMQDFGLHSQQQPLMAAGMPSLMEISRAEEILAAAREALTAGTAVGRTYGAAANQFDSASLRREELNPRSMFAQPEGRWASAYNPTPLRPPGQQQVNAPIATTGGLANQDLHLLLSKQNPQGPTTLASAYSGQQQQQSPMMRQAMMNQMPSQNIAVIESLLLRQEEERLLMGKRQRGDDSSSPKKPPAAYGLHPSQFASQDVAVKPRKRRAKTFPVKLMETLMAHYDERYVAWLSDGRSFVVIQPDEFINVIYSQTFKNSKYASFVRKLNRWGFARLTSGTGTDCFYHPLFQRDRIDLAAQMLAMPRNDSKSAKKRKEMGAEGTPAVAAATAAFQERPSLAGVDKFMGKEDEQQVHGTPNGSDATVSDEEGTPDNRKRAALTGDNPSPSLGRN